MYLQEIAEVAIGLIFMWLVLSIATMQIQEWITTFSKKRAKDLEGAIRKMLADPKLSDYFYDHPLIRGLSTGSSRPSYIPANQFAMALFDVVMTAGTEASLIQQGLYSLRDQVGMIKKKSEKEAAAEGMEFLLDLARRAAATEAGTALADAAIYELKKQIVSYREQYPELRPAIDLVMTEVESRKGDIVRALKGAAPAPAENGTLSLDQLRQGVVALTVISPQLKQTLATLMAGVEEYAAKGEGSIATARKNVECWFDDSMTRLGGVFKRNATKMAFIIGFVIALAVNVDSIALATHLWREPTVRQALIANADKFIVEHPEGVQTTEGEAEGSIDPSTAVREFRDQFAGLNIPMGWNFSTELEGGKACNFMPAAENDVFGIWFNGKCYQPADTLPNTSGISWALIKLAGILMSGAAAAQGAPFWFDILKKVVNVRGSGGNPAEAKK